MTQIEAGRLLLSLEQGNFADRAADTAPSVWELWAAIRSASDVGIARLEGVEAVAHRSNWEYPTVGQVEAFVADLEASVRIIGDGHVYHLEYEFQSDHEAGEGGRALSVSEIVRDETPVLASVSRTSYTTLSNDSEDYQTDRRDDLYLLDRHDALAVFVFEEVRQTAPRKPR